MKNVPNFSFYYSDLVASAVTFVNLCFKTSLLFVVFWLLLVQTDKNLDFWLSFMLSQELDSAVNVYCCIFMIQKLCRHCLMH